MAQLFRLSNIGDTADTVNFTFILPSQTLTPDTPPEILSRDFSYAGLRWRLLLSKRDTHHLSPYLELGTPSTGLFCRLDFTFLLLNGESFTQNERFTTRQCEFSATECRHGARTFVAFQDLRHRKGFTTHRRELLLELTMRNPHCRFDVDFSVQVRNSLRDDLDYQRYDSNRFVYGEQEWQVVFCPNMEDQGRLRHLVQLQRLNRSDVLCRIRYMMTLGSSDRKFRSGVREDLVDFSGCSEGIYLSEDYLKFIHNGVLHVSVDLLYVASLSQTKLNLTQGTDSRKTASAVCLDNERQGWAISANICAEYLYLSMFYSDLANIPRGYLRYVSWRCQVVPGPRAAGSRLQPAHSERIDGYWMLDSEPDRRGTRFRIPIPNSQISHPNSPWIDVTDGRLTVEIDWLQSQLLLRPVYNSYDDIIRRHVLQMRREVEALQSENNSLEKELHKYQQSIASKCSHVPNTQSVSPSPRLSTSSLNDSGLNHSEHVDVGYSGKLSPSPEPLVSTPRSTYEARKAHFSPQEYGRGARSKSVEPRRVAVVQSLSDSYSHRSSHPDGHHQLGVAYQYKQQDYY